MNKILAYLLLTSLLLSLCSCAVSKQEELGREEPESVPEVESIVEPITGEDEASEPADVPSEITATSGAPGEAGVTAYESGRASPGEPVVTEPASEYLAGPDPSAEATASAEEIYGAVSHSGRLDSNAIEKELLRLINSLRYEAGTNPLGIEDNMQFAAGIRAAEALESFSHTRPDGAPYNTAFDEAGFSYTGKWHGENLSSLSFSEGMFDEKEIALEMFKGLKNSPGHYRNMTEVNFLQAGIGVAILYSDDIVDVASAQMFSSL